MKALREDLFEFICELEPGLTRKLPWAETHKGFLAPMGQAVVIDCLGNFGLKLLSLFCAICHPVTISHLWRCMYEHQPPPVYQHLWSIPEQWGQNQSTDSVVSREIWFDLTYASSDGVMERAEPDLTRLKGQKHTLYSLRLNRINTANTSTIAHQANDSRSEVTQQIWTGLYVYDPIHQ